MQEKINRAFRHFFSKIPEQSVIIKEDRDWIKYTVKDICSGDEYNLYATLDGDELQVFNEDGDNIITDFTEENSLTKEEIHELQFGWKKNEPAFLDCPNISIPLANGKELVADMIPGSELKEIFVYIRDDNVAYQDLAVIREEYVISDNMNIIPIPGKYEVLVYGNSDNEDWTNAFQIPEYVEQ